MNQGTVMELDRRTAVVLTPDGQFIRVKRQAKFGIGDEVGYSTSVRAIPRVRQRLFQAGALASAMLLIMIGLWMFRTPPVVAYVTMDINPSLELGLDAKMRVRELRAVNTDAEAIVAGLKYRGQNLETVMNELARRLVEKHILTLEEGEVVIASIPMSTLGEQWEDHVTQKMTRILNEATKQEDPGNTTSLDVTAVSLPVEVRDKAEANGVSSGKMAFWLISESQGHEVSMKTLKEQSLKKIAASWGGVHKVMSSYELKSKDKDSKENKGNKEIKETKENKSANKNNDSKKNDNVKDGGNKGNNDNKGDQGRDIKNNKNTKDTKDIEDNQDEGNNQHKGNDKAERWKQLLDKAKKSDQSNASEKSKSSDREDSSKDSKERDD
jgi:hypothetical protein